MGSLCSLGASVYYNTRFDIRFPQAAATFTFSPTLCIEKGFTWTFYFLAKMRGRNVKFLSHQILAVLADSIADSKARGCIFLQEMST